MNRSATSSTSPDVSNASYVHDIPAERPWSRVLKRGQTLRIVDSEGQQAVDALLYCAENPAERYSSQDTLRVQGSAYVELGTQLISNKGRVMAHLTADSGGRFASRARLATGIHRPWPVARAGHRSGTRSRRNLRGFGLSDWRIRD